MKHFFGTLKIESGYDNLLKSGLLSYEETKKLVVDFIDYHNNERIQQNLGWRFSLRHRLKQYIKHR